jgi:hypothetical protein
MKETHTVRRKVKKLKAQTFMRDVESFAPNCTQKYGTPVTSTTRNQNTATKCKALVQNVKISLCLVDRASFTISLYVVSNLIHL